MRPRPIILTLVSLLVAVGLGRVALAQNYIEPGSAAPNGAIAPPLNGSNSAQRKSGTLIIGPEGGASKLCLNADAAQGVNDSGACISSWSQLSNLLGGPYLNRYQSAVSGNPLSADSYSHQDGFVRVQAIGATQSFSTITSVGTLCWDTEFNTACTGGVCQCLNNPGSGCRENADCLNPVGGQPLTRAGIFSTDGGNASAYAGYFGGKFYIQPDSAGNPGELCLNGIGLGSCISSWDQISGGGGVGYVKLQANPPTEKQIGGTSISGFGQLSSVIAGDSSANGIGDKLCGGVGIQLCICGDGLCTAGRENAVFCAVDCAPVSTIGLNVFVSHNSGVINATTASQSPTGQVDVLVVRSAGTPTSFTPQIGAEYQTGMQFGTTKVVYAGKANQNTAVSIPNDSGLTTGTLYYYRAWQGNLYPRYGNFTEKTLRFHNLTINKVGGGATSFILADVIDGSGDSLTCLPDCVGSYVENSVVSLTGVISGGSQISWGGDCSGTSECVLTMNSDKHVDANIVKAPKGGF